MALITCPECGGKVSSTASACPHCGYVFSEEEKEKLISSKKYIINVKRVGRVIGKGVEWHIYLDGKKLGEINNNGLFSFTVEKPGKYEVIVYHPFDAPDTKPLMRAKCQPAVTNLEVLPSDSIITINVNLNSGMFKSSLVVMSVDRE